MCSTKIVLWTFIFSVLTLLCQTHQITDPWGENLRPKLSTDYLSSYSGKPLSHFY